MNVYTIPDLGAEHRRCIPLTLFGCDHYSNYNIGRIENVGEYLLDTFPNCETCILELHKELTYEVLSSGGVLEEGNWDHREGQDYWIVELGELWAIREW